MGKIPAALIKKIENNIDMIGNRLCDFSSSKSGNYLDNLKKAIPIGHIFNWTQSFFTGMALWAYVDTNNKKFLDWVEQYATAYRDKVFGTPMETMHDVGFLYSPYAVMLYKLTGKEEYKEMGVRAADALAMRYIPNGKYIRAWGRMDDVIPEYVDPELAKDHFFTESKGLAIIDCMMNIPLLFWASEVTGHPFYRNIAISFADTVKKYWVREDWSVMHAYRFDVETGKPLGEENYCGYSKGSYWARGAAWAIYGYAIAYRYTGKEEYWDTVNHLLDKFMESCKGEIPPFDFKMDENANYGPDTSAAAITICGILELLKHGEDERLERYYESLNKAMQPYIDYDLNKMGLLSEQNGCHLYAAFGDYYLIESYMKRHSQLEVW